MSPDAIGISLRIGATLFFTLMVLFIKLVADQIPTGQIVFYFALTCTLAGLATLPAGWIIPNQEQLMLLIGCGFAGGVAHIMMTLSYQYSEVSKLATFEYLALAFAVVADFVFFAIVPELNFYLSSVLIIAATLVVILLDRPTKTSVICQTKSSTQTH